MVLEYTVYSPAPPPTEYKHPHPNLLIFSSFNNAPGIVFIGDYLWTPYLKAQGISDTENSSSWKRMISYFTKRRGTITFTVPNHPSTLQVDLYNWIKTQPPVELITFEQDPRDKNNWTMFGKHTNGIQYEWKWIVTIIE
jgi:hypothetical protein